MLVGATISTPSQTTFTFISEATLPSFVYTVYTILFIVAPLFTTASGNLYVFPVKNNISFGTSQVRVDGTFCTVTLTFWAYPFGAVAVT